MSDLFLLVPVVVFLWLVAGGIIRTWKFFRALQRNAGME